MLVIGLFILLAVGLYALVVYRQPGLPIVFLRNDRGAQEKTKVLLLTAHPDDECMFFAPTVLLLARQPEVEIHLFCVTKGDHERLGDTRMRELEKSCAVLGIDIRRVTVLDHPDFKDDPKARWNTALLGRLIEEHVVKHSISRVITFDWQGISGHINHIALERSVRHMLATSQRVNAISLPTYTLTTVPLVRKYFSLGDILFSVPIRYVIGSALEREDDNIMVVASPDDYRRGVHAMRQHASQMVWFRQLYVIFSRYMFINVLQRVG
ncbi:putative deacetylase LmbE-like domain-containing protein [Thamnocephalis sphaerospora]|uniref:N-acetylglucosaminylphosphatidylinositol deacetylase n=1 Tax=Thamnocephalis sphaerospora TaxID=78915 RepID=A0A4P9XGK0_9FUNG|nr:putative deacetylase LmbE-like domain-containing protein [Thamnocephalis sphaerospora]|eukprot:RKP04764.1 putative deacetylase LmbE-like domain-containing protein [Thamnocephalis sphaerospora]